MKNAPAATAAKQKPDRLLKLLPLKDRRRQEQIRRLILEEQLFKNI